MTDDLNKLAGTPEKRDGSVAESLLGLGNILNPQKKSIEETIKEVVDATEKAIQCSIESKVSELEAELARKNFDAYRDKGFTEEQAIQLLCAKYRAPKA
jgi:hypothetical protein